MAPLSCTERERPLLLCGDLLECEGDSNRRSAASAPAAPPPHKKCARWPLLPPYVKPLLCVCYGEHECAQIAIPSYMAPLHTITPTPDSSSPAFPGATLPFGDGSSAVCEARRSASLARALSRPVFKSRCADRSASFITNKVAQISNKPIRMAFVGPTTKINRGRSAKTHA